jgi:hypothetical protein
MAQILGTGLQRAGRNSRISCEGQNLNLTKWDVGWTVGDEDTTNFGSQTAVIGATLGSNIYMSSEGIFTISDFEWSLSGLWDAGANPVDITSVPGIFPRDDLANLLFFVTTVGVAPDWDFEYARVRSSKNGTEVKGTVSFEASGKNQGLVSIPTGSD